MKQRKKMSTSNKVLVASIAAIVIFTIISFALQFITGTETSSALIENWYRFWTVEIVVLSGIKVSKVLKNNNTDGVYETCDDEESEE